MEEDEHSNRNSYPATQKDAIRNHISTLCRVPNCVETLVIYLNSPTTNDGASLLWDTDNNGVVSYAVQAACHANCIDLILDTVRGSLVWVNLQTVC